MKKILIIGLLASLTACGGNDDNNLASNTATLPIASAVENGAAADGSQNLMSSNDLLMTAYQDGQAEIQLSQLALQRSANSEVKAFAQRMIDDHTLMNNEIIRLAGPRNVTLSGTATADQQAVMMGLQALSGADFDKAYMDLNVLVHDKDVAQFRLQTIQAVDTDIRQLAAVAYPILKLHLASAEELDGLVNPPAFLMSAYQDGLAEIQLSQLALQKATRDDVKAYAQRMITDHTTINNQILQLAQQKGVTLPTGLTLSQQVEMADMNRFSGADFEKAYMDMNVVAHTKDVSATRRQTEQGIDGDVKALAQTSLPILTQHLQLATDLDKIIQPSLLYAAAQNGLANTQLAGLALLKSANADVRTFAQRLISDQNGIRGQLTSLSQQKNVPIPTEVSPEQAAAFAGLVTRSGTDFDQAFIKGNLSAFSQQIALLGTQSGQSTDTDIQTFATNLLTILQAEQAAAQGINLPVSGG